MRMVNGRVVLMDSLLLCKRIAEMPEVAACKMVFARSRGEQYVVGTSCIEDRQIELWRFYGDQPEQVYFGLAEEADGCPGVYVQWRKEGCFLRGHLNKASQELDGLLKRLEIPRDPDAIVQSVEERRISEEEAFRIIRIMCEEFHAPVAQSA